MKLTFAQVFALSLVGLIVILALLFHLVSSNSRSTITESSELIREEASKSISERITQFLTEAPNTARQFQREVEQGLDGLKDKLFRLELRRQAGTISEEEYTRERNRTEQVLRELVRG